MVSEKFNDISERSFIAALFNKYNIADKPYSLVEICEITDDKLPYVIISFGGLLQFLRNREY